MVIQKIEEVIGFFFLETDNGLDEGWVDIESLLTSHRMDTNNGVLGFDRFTANRAVTSSGVLG